MKRVLIVTPSYPLPATGAEQLDRAQGIRDFVRLGYEVRVIAKVPQWADLSFIEETARDMGVVVRTVPYRFSNRVSETRGQRVKKFLGKFAHPLYLDGAAYEYSEPGIRRALTQELEVFKPDVVWFEYTYLWPLYGEVRKRGIPIITRSINFEPEHFLEEDGRTVLNYLKFIPKFFGEWLTVRMSEVMVAITPKEEKIYRRLGARFVSTLPLRGLPRFTELPRPQIREHKPLHAFFMGSSYRVAHNKAALAYLLQHIAPQVESQAPGSYVFHVLGTKIPADLEKYFDGVLRIYDGPKYKDELDAYIKDMDVAVVPSLMGAGQQQKVFEPISRGIPTVTSARAINGYSLEGEVHYLPAWKSEEFVAQLIALREVKLRESLSHAASIRTQELFAQDAIDEVVKKALAQAKI